MKQVFIFFALLLFIASAAATEMRVGINWNLPTKYTNGDTIGPNGLERFNLWCGTSSGNYAQDMLLTADTTAVAKETLMDHFDLKFNRVYYCAATATATNGMTSDFSNEVNFTVPDERVPESQLIGVQ